MRCARTSERTGRCESPAVATVHDRRGCLALCVRHALERLQQSFAVATGGGCPCGGLDDLAPSDATGDARGR